MTIYTVSDLAEMLKRSRSSITSLIESRKLIAFDSSPDGKHRQYRVTQEALEDFIAANQIKAKPKAKRRSVPKPVRQYV